MKMIFEPHDVPAPAPSLLNVFQQRVNDVDDKSLTTTPPSSVGAYITLPQKLT